MTRINKLGIAVAVASIVAGCFDPQDRTPGTRLSGQLAETPSDWKFTDEHELIAIEVQTPYMLPHSVTIWCVEVKGLLYIGARKPKTKRWPGWADRNPDVRLGIGSQIFEVRLVPLTDPELIANLPNIYAAKYDLPPPSDKTPLMRYWLVEPRQ